jgi:hypothetical protein
MLIAIPSDQVFQKSVNDSINKWHTPRHFGSLKLSAYATLRQTSLSFGVRGSLTNKNEHTNFSFGGSDNKVCGLEVEN